MPLYKEITLPDGHIVSRKEVKPRMTAQREIVFLQFFSNQHVSPPLIPEAFAVSTQPELTEFHTLSVSKDGKVRERRYSNIGEIRDMSLPVDENVIFPCATKTIRDLIMRTKTQYHVTQDPCEEIGLGVLQALHLLISARRYSR